MELSLIALLALLCACESRAEAAFHGLRGARFADPDGALMYRYFVPPEADADHPLPLVLYLHGDDRQGIDNQKQVDSQVTHWIEHRATHPCFVLAPQLPKGFWVATDFAKGNYAYEEQKLTESMKLVLGLVELFVKHYAVDRARIYVAGSEIGGFGTWDLLTRKPEWFAAAVPIDGGGDPAQVARFAKIPIWAFHGRRDHAVPVAATRAMIEALEKAGGSPKYTEYKDVDHDSARRALTPELDAWLFAQRRPLR